MSEKELEDDDARSDPSKPTKLVSELRHRYSQDFVGHPFHAVFAGMDEERTKAADEIMRLRWVTRQLRRRINAKR